MNDKIKIFLALLLTISLAILLVLLISFAPLLLDKIQYKTTGNSPIHQCELEGGVYRDMTFETPKCYVGNEIYEIYYKDGEYKLAK